MRDIVLIGAEDVRRAGVQIANAAQEARQIQGWQAEEMQRHRTFMDEWLDRFEAVLEKAVPQ